MQVCLNSVGGGSCYVFEVVQDVFVFKLFFCCVIGFDDVEFVVNFWLCLVLLWVGICMDVFVGQIDFEVLGLLCLNERGV